MSLTRRGFLTGCSAAIAAFAGTNLNTLAFGDPGGNGGHGGGGDVLVHVFLRGGMDGLHLMPPLGGSDRAFYEEARPQLKVPTAGNAAALPLNDAFGLHPAAAPLLDLYRDGQLAIVQATGLHVPTRSHFDAMQYIELGTPGAKNEANGWLTRYLQTIGVPAEAAAPSLAVGTLRQTSLLGAERTINLDSIGGFSLNTVSWRWRPGLRTALRQLYESGDSWRHQSGQETLNALDLVELYASPSYKPAHGAAYPEGEFGQRLQAVAQLIRLELGLRVATLDFGGWDTHEGQGNGSGGYFAQLVTELARGLKAFMTDLDGHRLTLIVQSEFGRRLRQNANDGTDHGHGNLMMVLSRNIRGGIYGTWPGLDNDQLFDRADLAVTTDYRHVLAELLTRQLNRGGLEAVFPGLPAFEPLGLVPRG